MLKVKTQCTYGRGGEEINDTTRHDYVSLELNTLRVGKKMEIRVVYKHTPFPPPSVWSPSSLSLSVSPPPSPFLFLPPFLAFLPPLHLLYRSEWIEEKWEGEWCRLEMLIIISAQAPFYNTVIPSHLDPKYGIWGGEAVTVMLGFVWGGGHHEVWKFETFTPEAHVHFQVGTSADLGHRALMKGLGAGGHWEFLRFPRDFLLQQK